MFDWVLKTSLYFPGLSFQSISASSKDLFSKYSFDWQVNMVKVKVLNFCHSCPWQEKFCNFGFTYFFNTDLFAWQITFNESRKNLKSFMFSPEVLLHLVHNKNNEPHVFKSITKAHFIYSLMLRKFCWKRLIMHKEMTSIW